MSTIPAARRRRRLPRALTLLVAPALLVTGLGTLPPTGAAAQPLPDGAETFLVSRTEAGESTQPFLTADGQRVVFASTAPDLVPGDDNGAADVFLATATTGSDDPFAGEPVLVSRPDDALGVDLADGDSGEPVASVDGRYVAFSSTATNLVDAASTPGRSHVYLRDLLRGTTVRIDAGIEPDGDSYAPDLSDDGRYLVFTSEASNLSPEDVNEAPDAFLVDLDSDGDGVPGDLTITRFLPDRSVPGGTAGAVISANGERVAFTAYVEDLSQPPGEVGDQTQVFTGTRAGAAADAVLVAAAAREPAIDAAGEVVAFIADVACGGDPIVAAWNLTTEALATVGWRLVDRRVGIVRAPAISADGNVIAFQTTQPEFDFGGDAEPLPEPVVRIQRIAWLDARVGTMPCSGIVAHDWYDVAEGGSVTLSASGRTLAYSGPAPEAGAPVAVLAVDTHEHQGLSVTPTGAELFVPGFMTEVDLGAIPVAQLRDYASALANAPIHHLPIHHLPIHHLPIHHLPIHHLLIEDAPVYRLPIHHLPIHHLPIHHLDIPGGWAELLAGTPFAGELLHTVQLHEVLAWAEQTLADGSGATEPERAAAQRIQSLTLGHVDLSRSGIDGLALASFVLGSAPLAQVEIPGTGTPAQRWQALLDAQGIALTVEADTVLAQLDSAGLDIGRSGVEAVPLTGLPVEDTLLGQLPVTSLFLADTPLGAVQVSDLDEAAQQALFGPTPPGGTLAEAAAQLLDSATVADLAHGAPPEVTVGTLLFSLLDVASYPWEQIEPASINQDAILRATGGGCSFQQCLGAEFSFTFDAGPGEPTTFAAPLASILLPAGTAQESLTVRGAGPWGSWQRGEDYQGPVQADGALLRFPLADTPSGTVLTLVAAYSASTAGPRDDQAVATLSSGALSASGGLWSTPPLADYDDPRRNLVDGIWEEEPEVLREGVLYYEWISPLYRRLNDFGEMVTGPASDEDYYLIEPPAPGQRLVVSTNATDGQISMALSSPSTEQALGLDSAGPAPGVVVTEQSGPPGAVAQAGGDAGAPLQGHQLVDQVVGRGGGIAQIEAASTDTPAGEPLLLRVTSGNGEPASALYSIRIRYVEEPAEVVCPPWTPAQTTDPGVVGSSDPVTAETNTLFLVDTVRFGDTHGAAAAAQVRAGLDSLTGVGALAGTGVHGAVLSVDADATVRGARETLDANPCSMSARRALTAAVNAYLAEQVDDHDGIAAIVLVGGDDILPFAPVAQRTAQFNEASHAPALRLTEPLGGGDCPGAVAPGQLDPCATPLSAAAATNHILTDDPYGLATAYESLGGHLYVPTVALGRLVETPEQILAAVDRFAASDGELAADSTLTGGYGAWSELPELVTDQLQWRSAQDLQLAQPWDRDDVLDALLPAEGPAPRVVSVNTHADETRMLPGVEGAPEGRFGEADLLHAEGLLGADQLGGALVFLIGCHAGNNLPGAYYGDLTDWADVFAGAGGYVGNTGYGLANSVSTALSERLLVQYAAWLGAQSGGVPVPAGAALTYAKQSYLGGLGLYSGYDEKILMQTVYYGLPMYTLAGPATELPLPQIPAGLTPVTVGSDGLATASLELTPVFSQQTGTDDSGREVSYLTADEQDPLVVAGQPILPRVTSRLAPDPEGRVPRGAFLTALVSERSDPVVPAIAQPTVGVPDPGSPQRGAAFPATFATVSGQDTPDGPVDLLVVTPGRVQTGPDGAGYLERFTELALEVTYADPDVADTAPPLFTSVEVPDTGGSLFSVQVDGTGSEVLRVLLLAQAEGDTEWQLAELDLVGQTWHGSVDAEGPVRWILQAVDAAGNVAVESARGQVAVAAAEPPELGDAGPDLTLRGGGRMLRSVEVVDAAPDERLTARFRLVADDGEVAASGEAVVGVGDDGRTQVVVDRVVETPGTSTVVVEVCRGRACSTTSFGLQVLVGNTAPTATVSLTSDTDPVTSTSVLTATAEASDPDDDPVTLSYAWWRNGIPLEQASGSSLALHGLAEVGDVIRVSVTPHDGQTAGHAGSDQVVVAEQGVPPDPPAPVLTITAVAGGVPYLEGEWSTLPVEVSFSCESEILVTPCPDPVVVSEDTTTDGILVQGSITDELGRTATASILVRLDHTPPSLAPRVVPDQVVRHGAAVAHPNAVDSASGLAEQWCEEPSTAQLGTFVLSCWATDVAGNTATAAAKYTVVAAPPGARPSTTIPGVGRLSELRPSGV